MDTPTKTNRILRHVVILSAYALLFVVLTWPSASRFNTHILADDGDGYQMYWNIWWVCHAVTSGYLSIFETPLLFYPATPSLFVHSLHPFGGLLTVPLHPFLGDVTLFNLVVVFAFAVSGWGAYLLARRMSCSGLPAFVGGYLFTFCNYHFAHAEGHLNLVLMQWIPFYFLFFYNLVNRHRFRDAILSALFLFLVLLCDHYYFLYCVIASVVFVQWGLCARSDSMWTGDAIRRFLVFGLLVATTSGVFCLQVLTVASAGRISGHDSSLFGMDLLALVIPGGHWRFHSLTAGYWQALTGNIHESSVHLGLAAMSLAVGGYVALRRRRDPVRFLWGALALLFFVMSLGSDLRVVGNRIDMPMPYDLLERVFPFIQMGGTPARFIVIAILALSILAACGVQWLLTSRRKRVVLGAVLCVAVLELLPRPVPNTPVEFPPHVKFLALYAAEKPGAVLDLVDSPQLAMVYQTLHMQPIQIGYLARTEQTVQESSAFIQMLLDQRDFATLASRFGFRYVIGTTPPPNGQLIFDGVVQVYEIGTD